MSLTSCSKKSGEAIVLEKEHIAIAELRPTPNEQLTTTPAASPPTRDEERQRELRPDEIVVDGYVMDKDVRGTSKDPRANDHEQWIVRVQLTAGGRRIDVHAEQAQYQKLKTGDRVEVTYREGNYTGTVWSAEIQ